MKEIDKQIIKHYENSVRLRELCFKNDNLSYEKSKELQKLQDDEYKKMVFLKNLKKEITKKDENERNYTKH